MLHYEQLDVYKCAKQFAELSFEIIDRLPRGNAELGDQLKRATISILLNVAEGSGKTSVRDRAGYYAIARGSAMECSAVLDVLHLLSLVTTDALRAAKDLTERIVSMLTKMTRRWPSPSTSPPPVDALVFAARLRCSSSEIPPRLVPVAVFAAVVVFAPIGVVFVFLFVDVPRPRVRSHPIAAV